jgi:ligand-binding sensor domain-containing protein/signal transduction histidine kinase/DNA-binding response OmpR family regulator
MAWLNRSVLTRMRRSRGRSIILPVILLLVGLKSNSQSLLFRNLTIQQGLPQNSVMAITEDKKGFIWLGTRYGLSRYDGHHFRNYTNDPADTTSLADNQVAALLTDSDGTLWIASNDQLCKYDASFDRFQRVPYEPKRKQSLNSRSVDCFFEDRDKNIWIGTRSGLNLVTDRAKNLFTSKFALNGSTQPIAPYANTIFQSTDGALWIGTSQGLIRMHYENGRISSYDFYRHDPNDPQSISDNHITAISEDRDHRLWIGTQNDGVNILTYANGTIRRVTLDGLNHPAIINGNVRELIADQQGRMWIGTQNGLYIYDPVKKALETYQHNSENKSGLSNNSIHSLYYDKNGTAWVGTYHGGVNIAYRYSTPFTVYQNNYDPHSLNNDVVSGIIEDDRHNLWIGTEGGGLNYFDRVKGSFQNYRQIPGDSNSLSSNFIKCLYRDLSGNIWIGTSYNGGLNRLDPRTGRFSHHNLQIEEGKKVGYFDEVLAIQEKPNGDILIGALRGLYELKKHADGSFDRYATNMTLPSDLTNKSVQALLVDSRKNLWIGGQTGLHLLRGSDQKLISFTRNAHPDSLHEHNINFIREDSKGQIWIGTYYGGLYKYNISTNSFTNYTQKDGLPNNNILGLLEDRDGFYWISTDNGLSRFNLAEKTFKNYTVSDGLAGNKFNHRSFFKDSRGEMFFGGNNGLTAFFPEKIQVNKYVGDLVFTSLKLSGNPVSIGGPDQLLQQSFTTTNELVFKHDQRLFTVDFALLNFIKPEKNRYAYKLEGYEEKWNYVNEPSATYSNLPAGNYTLLVKAANNDGFWTPQPASLQIQILPPLWKTWWAYTIYALAACGLAFFIIRFFYMRALFRKEHLLHQFKLNFFTNVSHEIRTHLTLISTPVDQLIRDKQDDPATGRKLQHVKTHTERLAKLINELMDFRKAETNNLPLHIREWNIVSFLATIFHSFHDLSQSRKIELSFVAPPGPLPVYFDKQQLEKVIFNLITNAFKFTPDGGFIRLEVKERNDDIVITVTDNGKGIAPENLKKIFTNFFQVDDEPSHNTGYGIGLALSKSLVELHEGSLSVTSAMPAHPSQPGNTCFSIVLLKGHAHFNTAQLTRGKAAAPLIDTGITIANHESALAEEIKKPVVLLVEDNHELRSFLRETLSRLYTIIESDTGTEGLRAATEQIPDLIISDVMMPEMDGYTLCRRLKTDERTCHIPVILLTAKASSENHVEGLEMGAEIYLTKPFSLQVLELHVHNLIASRVAMRQKYSRQVTLEPKQVEISNVDEGFLQKVMDIIEEHMDDAEFGVALLARKVAMSQPVLYKKLKALTDMTVNDFIKSIRLKKAALLLQQQQLTIAEVAYTVGFTRREHFSEEFKKQFGQTPSEYVKDNRQREK